ncbi:hypothetical protein PN36_34085 [Candidatus Thiomargarita nelsonii]|uniref:Uncharacterized protein n=1 Tax=Candidatus Thiomargarita nelsonii TaxID=1003181 RepID=A0A4E0RMC0_9GAMM|nr:hypothetical protein PN36_34085 [Candidatus Thiomargarita nelsonii]
MVWFCLLVFFVGVFYVGCCGNATFKVREFYCLSVWFSAKKNIFLNVLKAVLKLCYAFNPSIVTFTIKGGEHGKTEYL